MFTASPIAEQPNMWPAQRSQPTFNSF